MVVFVNRGREVPATSGSGAFPTFSSSSYTSEVPGKRSQLPQTGRDRTTPRGAANLVDLLLHICGGPQYLETQRIRKGSMAQHQPKK
jgi:hypothetical protein